MQPNANGTSSAQYGRPLSIEDASNRFFVHPLSSLVVKVALPLKLSANFVSILGLAAGLLAALFYAYQAHRIFVLAAFICMLGWHVLDGADGRIARATGTSSAFGRILDGVCDHLVFGSVYVSFVLYAISTGSSEWVWALALVSAASHAIQSAGYEERRQNYQRRSRGQTRAEVADTLLEVDGKKSWLAGLYDQFQKLSSTKSSPLDDRLDELRAKGASNSQIQALLNKTVPIVRAWALLNANNRTLLLAITALFGHPLYYFFIEIFVLNFLFVGLIMFERRCERSLARQPIAISVDG